jgi:hypothetical protein
MKSAAVERRRYWNQLFSLKWNSLVETPGLCPRLGFPPKKEMQTDSREKKQKEQDSYCTPAHPRIYPTCDDKQYAVFDNAKPAGLRMQGYIFFLLVEFLEGHFLPLTVNLQEIEEDCINIAFQSLNFLLGFLYMCSKRSLVIRGACCRCSSKEF